MKKRVIALILAAALTGLCGCSAFFKKEYLSVSEYTEGTKSDFDGDLADIEDYEGLTKAINAMLTAHKQEGRVVFKNYQGDLQSDLAQACWEVKTKSALGSYAVDYVSHDLNRIVTYYEATIYITYNRSQEELEKIHYVSGRASLVEELSKELESLSRYNVYRISSATITADEILSILERAYTSNPLSCVVEPKASVRLHPESGAHRIVEIDIDYGKTLSQLRGMKQELAEAINSISTDFGRYDSTEYARQAYNALASFCVYDPEGVQRAENGLAPELSSSPYGALVERYADSRGIALAYAALCQKVGIESIVINGSLEKQNHSWNIIKIDDSYYHVDVSADSFWGAGNSFMKSDYQMQGRYWWNIESYPESSDDTQGAAFS
ncbi:MAG: hypothetical protein GX025_00830 [Clostridiales bacterium]|nr:hypothetical protein [Clostridiales bacterium]